MKAPKCKHDSYFWFDRTVYKCNPDCDERMHDVCRQCGKTTCQIDKPTGGQDDDERESR